MTDQCWMNDIAASSDFTRMATSEAESYELEKALTDGPYNTWKTTGSGNQYYTFDGTSSNAVKAIVLININTDDWATLQAQADNSNFSGSPAATANFTIIKKKRTYYDSQQRKVIETERIDAYVIVDWNYQDYRILMNSTAVSSYEVGRIYISSKVISELKGSDFDTPVGQVSIDTIVEGESGQYRKISNGIRFEYEMNFKCIDVEQREWMHNLLTVNPSVIWWVDGIDTGQLFLGSVTVEKARNYDVALGGKNNISATFIESI